MAERKTEDPSGESLPGLSLNDRLGLISLIEEGARAGSEDAPIVADLFANLWKLVNTTAKGAKIDRLKPEETKNGFQTLEINSESGETLGRLNMLYLKKPIPSYYLVYVEVSAPFRKQGLGTRILSDFRDFLTEKGAVGLLDNIIPDDDPTFDIYLKNGWRPIESIIGDALSDEEGQRLIHVPKKLEDKLEKRHVLRLTHHLMRKREAIDMRDNEVMVRQTIAEFKDLYAALRVYFEKEIKTGGAPPLMRFMFTRFATKFISFRRRIGELLGYTGGDSLEQVSLAPEVAAMPIKSYAPRPLAGRPELLFGEMELWEKLPAAIREDPAIGIESLPNYQRPNLSSWLDEKGLDPADPLTIGDLLDLGFDPTRLKEVNLQGRPHIFERMQRRQFEDLLRKKELLDRAAQSGSGLRVKNALVEINPPLLAIGNRGNVYVLRRKVEGVHWEEAVHQLRVAPRLKSLNQSLGGEALVKSTVRLALKKASRLLEEPEEDLRDLMSVFVSWDLRSNQPRVGADFSGTFLETVWLA